MGTNVLFFGHHILEEKECFKMLDNCNLLTKISKLIEELENMKGE